MEKYEIDGQLGEKQFRQYLDRLAVPYLPIGQEPETYALQFHGTAKRPDALVMAGAKIVAVDVKYKRPGFYGKANTPCVGLNYYDIEKLAEFERISGIPVFVAFFDGWNYGRTDLWRVARLSTIQIFREFEYFVVIELNALPLVFSRKRLMQLLIEEAAQ
jgi:hypothetical protein